MNTIIILHLTSMNDTTTRPRARGVGVARGATAEHSTPQFNPIMP